MSIIFLIYLVAFLMILRKHKKLAYFFFIAASIASLIMFSYHTTSSLNLNF